MEHVGRQGRCPGRHRSSHLLRAKRNKKGYKYNIYSGLKGTRRVKHTMNLSIINASISS